MKNHTVNGTFFTFKYPDNWEVEDNGNIVSVFDPEDGLGAIQFSYYLVDNPETINVGSELKEYLRGKYGDLEIIKSGRSAYCAFDSTDMEKYWRFWMFLIENNVVFITYNCSLASRGAEDQIVDQIVEASVAGL